MPRVTELRRHAVASNLVELVDRHERLIVQRRGHAEALEHAAQEAPVIEPNDEVAEPQPTEHIADRGADFGFDHRRSRADGVDVALIELAEPAAGRTVRPPHRLNLVALEEARQLAAVLGHHRASGTVRS